MFPETRGVTNTHTTVGVDGLRIGKRRKTTGQLLFLLYTI